MLAKAFTELLRAQKEIIQRANLFGMNQISDSKRLRIQNIRQTNKKKLDLLELRLCVCGK